MAEVIAEYTIQEVAEDGMCKVQYMVGGEVLFEGKEYPHSLTGHPYFSDLVRDTLSRIKE